MDDFKLIAEGSSGCIFSPMIPCKKKTKRRTKKKKNKKTLTKLLFKNDIREINFNKKIEKIKDYKKWAILWSDTCLSPKFKNLKKYKEFRNCTDALNKRTSEDYHYILLQGYYNGDSLYETFSDVSKETLLNRKLFIKFFLKIFRVLKNIFYAIKQLHLHHVCHHDITSRNILVKDGSSYLIDYDISIDINSSTVNDKFLLKRMDDEVKYSRIYEIYPFEYYYHRVKNISKEIDNIHQNKSNQINYKNIYKPMQDFFNIDEKNLRLKLLQSKLDGKKTNVKGMINKLDTYSLGATLIILFIDFANDKNIDYRIVLNHMESPKLKNHMDLIRDMIQFNHTERISPDVAYKRYLKLIHKTKKSKKKTLT